MKGKTLVKISSYKKTKLWEIKNFSFKLKLLCTLKFRKVSDQFLNLTFFVLVGDYKFCNAYQLRAIISNSN